MQDKLLYATGKVLVFLTQRVDSIFLESTFKSALESEIVTNHFPGLPYPNINDGHVYLVSFHTAKHTNQLPNTQSNWLPPFTWTHYNVLSAITRYWDGTMSNSQQLLYVWHTHTPLWQQYSISTSTLLRGAHRAVYTRHKVEVQTCSLSEIIQLVSSLCDLLNVGHHHTFNLQACNVNKW